MNLQPSSTTNPTELLTIPKTSPHHISKYWDKHLRSKKPTLDPTIPRTVVREARILSLSDPTDDANRALHVDDLPEGATLLGVGTSFEEFDIEYLKEAKPNVVFVSHFMARDSLAKLLDALPSLEWVHSRSAGIDFIFSPTLSASNVKVTNAKGQYSSTLAEYTMMACSYFAKDLPRLLRQKNEKQWGKYSVKELRGATMGIIGYGDIGQACAKLAKPYGMRVMALRRNPQFCSEDPYCDIAYGNSIEDLKALMSESDYIVCSAPLTKETMGLLGKEAFDHAKKGAVFINVGRGPIVVEDELIDALKDGRLKGAALDVFATEPLPIDSELWSLENVLISPHNMDQTETFTHESTEFFVHENLERYIRGEELLNFVDKVAGY